MLETGVPRKTDLRLRVGVAWLKGLTSVEQLKPPRATRATLPTLISVFVTDCAAV